MSKRALENEPKNLSVSCPFVNRVLLITFQFSQKANEVLYFDHVGVNFKLAEVT